jgi:hypothetical protein
LSAVSDGVALFGKSSPGTLNQPEWLLWLESKFVPHGFLSTVDAV